MLSSVKTGIRSLLPKKGHQQNEIGLTFGKRYFAYSPQKHMYSWLKIAPHVHSNELDGDDFSACCDTRTKDQVNDDKLRGFYSKHGVCRWNLDFYNEQLGEDKFNIMVLSPNVTEHGTNPLVFGPSDYSNITSFKGVPGSEVQNEAAANPFEAEGPPSTGRVSEIKSALGHDNDPPPLDIHTLTIGNKGQLSGSQELDSISYIVHPYYYDTVTLIKRYFRKNPEYIKNTIEENDEEGIKPWILRKTDLQYDWDEIDVKMLSAIDTYIHNGERIEDVWDLVKETLQNQNSYLKNLNVQGIEVYNGFRAGEWSGRYLDEMLMLGYDYLAFAGNDAYFYQGEEDDSFQHLDDSRLVPLGCIYGVINTQLLNKSPTDALLSCINKREFYASSGLQIHSSRGRQFSNIVSRKGNGAFTLRSIKKVHWRAIQWNDGDTDTVRTHWSKPTHEWHYNVSRLEGKTKFKYVRFEARSVGVDHYHEQIWMQPYWTDPHLDI